MTCGSFDDEADGIRGRNPDRWRWWDISAGNSALISGRYGLQIYMSRYRFSEEVSMLQKTAEYALRATVWLAQEPGAPRDDQIARAIRVPRRYVHKVLQALVRAGIVHSQPGPGGGYSLKSRADQTTILDVITAVGPLQRIRRCPLGLQSHTDLCPLHRELDNAFATLEQAFARVTVADVVNRPSAITPLREMIASGTPTHTKPVSPGRDSGMPSNRE